MVIGGKVLFASLNHMNENDQKIIASITERYVLKLLLNYTLDFKSSFLEVANLYLNCLICVSGKIINRI